MTENLVEENSENPFFQLESDNLSLVGIKFTNGYFLVISEKESLKLGTTAISLPIHSFEQEVDSSKKTTKPIIDRKKLSTATIIGTRNELYTKALAERFVSLTGKMIYLSVNFQENNEELFLEAIKLIEKFQKEINL